MMQASPKAPVIAAPPSLLSAEMYNLQYAVNELLKSENESHPSCNCVRFPKGVCAQVCVF